MRRKMVSRILLVSMLAASLPAVPSARAESVFTAPEHSWHATSGAPSLRLGDGAPGPGFAASLYSASAQDTIETMDIELEDEAEGRSIYKEIAVVALVGAAVGYVVYLLIHAGSDEPSSDDGSNKPTPFSVAAFSPGFITRGR